MYAGNRWANHPDRPAVIMARSGESVSYAELERQSNRLAHFLRAHGIKRLDHYAIFMENNASYIECCAAGERAGLYYTCINSYLTCGCRRRASAGTASRPVTRSWCAPSRGLVGRAD